MSINPNIKTVLTKSETIDSDYRIPTLNLKNGLKQEKVQLQVENVVVTANLNQHLDLVAILQVTPGAKYDSQRFPGLIYKLKKPRTTTLLFASGKLVCTGAKSARSAKKAIAHIIDELTDHGIIIIERPDAEVQNIVASGDLHGMVDLENVAERLFNTMYEPEQFPGLIYRMDDPKVVLLIFANGKVVCTGAKAESNVTLAVEKLRDTLELNKLMICNDSESEIEVLTSRIMPQGIKDEVVFR